MAGKPGRPPPPTAWKKGASGNPKGKPKGAISKFTKMQLASVKEGVTPLEFLLAITRSDPDELKRLNIPAHDVDTKIRVKAAESAAPYCHRKMPIGIDNGAGGPVGHYTAEQLAALAPEELDVLIKVLGRLETKGMGIEGLDE